MLQSLKQCNEPIHWCYLRLIETSGTIKEIILYALYGTLPHVSVRGNCIRR